MFDALNKYVSHCVVLNKEEYAFFHSLLKHHTAAKKTFLLQKGEVCDFEAFILKGCIKKYYLDENGAEVIIQFGVENWWIGDLASFTEQQPSNLFIETIEDSEYLTISYANKEKLFAQLPKMERMFRLMVQRSYTVLQDRLFSTIANSAEERYLEFLKKYPEIPNRVPQHQIASYLGISPEFLSKIRAKLVNK